MTQQEALSILKLGHNVYLTGSAGSGKTYVLNQYIDYLKKHDVPVAVTASTGIAASHINGSTIHSWSGLGIRSTLTPYDLEAMEAKRYLWERFHNTKVLIIDEVSMLHHFRLDLIDEIARFFKRNNLPFGGMQVILCGDFFQLPPVTKSHEEPSHFIYHARAWDALKLKVCYLQGSYRQSDKIFLNVLNAIRENKITQTIKDHIQTRFNKEPEFSVKPTKLYTHNVDVDGINFQELAKIPGETRSYYMTDQGKDVLVASLKNNCLASEVLSLKKGAQVMFVKNNYDVGYVNGTLGTVIECTTNYPIIRTAQGKIIKAEPMEWMIEDDSGNVKAKIRQVPLRLAWAITIHKSQGMTLDAAEIDLSKAFEKGMGYVALSRVKSLAGLKLVGINDKAFEVHEDVLLFDEELQEASEKISTALAKVDKTEVEKMQKEYIMGIVPALKKKKKKVSASKGFTMPLILLVFCMVVIGVSLGAAYFWYNHIRYVPPTPITTSTVPHAKKIDPASRDIYRLSFSNDRKTATVVKDEPGLEIPIAQIPLKYIPVFGTNYAGFPANPDVDYLFETNNSIYDMSTHKMYFVVVNATTAGNVNADRALFFYDLTTSTVELVAFEPMSRSFGTLSLSPKSTYIAYDNGFHGGACSNRSWLVVFNLNTKKQVGQTPMASDETGYAELDEWLGDNQFTYFDTYNTVEDCGADKEPLVRKKTFSLPL